MKLKNEKWNESRNIVWNVLVIIVVGWLLIGAIEGIGFRHKIKNYYEQDQEDYYYTIYIVNLTKLGLYNSIINNTQVSIPSSLNVLNHDTYGLMVAGIVITFISALIPLTQFFFETNKENKTKKIKKVLFS
ncbi:hypothetical protein [Mesoplasma corruscae]|uniref:Uncharacterized protein n=1 Tax=Mesoplasma corruscae TaxID=216874 RepID=A0A2S5RG09_9MOLU|nr:hypothetical protein [Mesoplasma corruscae]PPE06228.1 hypothetical protein MCORR_v1c05320 [Mesoplasma corruscae]